MKVTQRADDDPQQIKAGLKRAVAQGVKLGREAYSGDVGISPVGGSLRSTSPSSLSAASNATVNAATSSNENEGPNSFWMKIFIQP